MSPWIAMLPFAMSALEAPEKARAAAAQRQLNAEMTKWSPWTGMRPSDPYVNEPSMIGGLAQGGLNSYQMYQNIDMMKNYNKLLEDMANSNIKGQ